jgi:hypothetical protein
MVGFFGAFSDSLRNRFLPIIASYFNIYPTVALFFSIDSNGSPLGSILNQTPAISSEIDIIRGATLSKLGCISGIKEKF